jgi:hypothetical protein
MELLILLALAGWAACGPVGHWHKTEPLRIAERRQQSSQAHERRMAWIARRGGRPTVTEAISLRIADRIINPRGGPAQQAAAEWWADSWLYATERRRARHEKAANGQLRRQRAARAVNEWVATRRRRSDAQDTPTRAQSDPWGRTQPQHQQSRDVEDDIVDAELVDDPDEHTEPSEPERQTDATADAQPAAPPPGAHADQAINQDTPPPESEQREDPTGQNPTGQNPPDDAQPAHDLPRPETLASVHPIRPIGKDHQDMSTHTVTSGETLDPAAGLTFVRSVRESTEQIMIQIELSETTLTDRGVTGEPVELLAQMREAFSTAVASCAAAAAHFERHLNIQDQVLADPTLAGSVHGTYVGTRS